MSQYDFIDAVVAAYSFLWRHRRMILALALIPLIIKIACMIAIFALGMEEQYLRQGLIALPAYFAEGVLMARIIIIAGTNGETLAPPPHSDDRRVMAATLLYVLIKLVVAFISGNGMEFVMAQQAANGGEEQQASAQLFFMGLFLTGLSVWAFRLVWLYIPLAQGYAIRTLLERMRGLNISFILIGTWLISFIPLALILIISAGLAADALGHSEDTPSMPYRFFLMLIQSALDIVATLVATLAISFGFHKMMLAPPPHPPLK